MDSKRMTREEEMKIAILKEHQRNQAIEQAAHQNTLEKNQGHNYTDWYFGFINGVQWADEHPKNNPVDIDEVCERLENYFAPDGSIVPENISLLRDLKRVIKGE